VSFTLVPPRAPETPLVVEVPHAGLGLDSEAMGYLAAPVHALARDADLFVDDLMSEAPLEGATLLVAHTSRYICDLNRGPEDVDAASVTGGLATPNPHGLIWNRTTGGQVALLGGPIPIAEYQRRLTSLYWPYHRALQDALLAKRARFGFSILLCAHSMPSRPLVASEAGRADVVPGSRGRTTCGPGLLTIIEDVVALQGWSLRHDDPYRGGHTTALHGRPAEGSHAVQVELARRLYLDETALTLRPDTLGEVRRFCRTLVRKLGNWRP
jgi:N-formylglutamate deformylase